MRRLLIVAALLALPLLAPLFVPGPTLGADGVAVGAAGLLLLGAFALAEIAAAAGISRVVGAVLGGALLGPVALAQAGPGGLGDLAWFRDLAAGVLALLAGASISLRGLGRSWRIVAAQLVGVTAATGVLIASSAPLGLPGLTGAPASELLLAGGLAGLALALGAPLVTAVVRGELRAAGPLSDAAQAIAGARTVVAAVLLGALLVAGAGASSAPLLGLAVTTGAAVGAAILGALWLRTGAPELMVLLAGTLSVTVTVRAGGGDPILALLFAGLLVRGLTDRGEHLAHLAEQASYPAVLLLFALVGASLDLEAVPRLGALALALLALRSLALLASSVGGARIARTPFSGRLLGGAQLLAGVLTLEAAASIARLGGPWARDVGTLLVLVTGGALLAGPVSWRIAVDRAGESERARRRKRRPEHDEEPKPAPELPARPRAAIPQPELLHPDLDRALSELRNRLFDVHERFVTDFLDERLHETRNLVGTLRDLAAARLAQLEVEAPDAPDTTRRDDAIRRAAEEIARDWRDAVAYHAASLQERGPDARALLALIRAVEDLVLSAPPVRIPLRDSLFTRLTDDGLVVRARKLRGRLRVRVGGRLVPRLLLREVPLARIGRATLSGPLPRVLEQGLVPFVGHRSVRLWHLLIEAQDELAQRLREAEGADRVEAIRAAAKAVDDELAALVADLQGYRDEIADRVLLALGDGFAALLAAAATAGTPLLPRRRTDPSRVYEDNRRARHAIEERLEGWWLAARGASGALMLRLDVAAMRRGALTRTTEAAARLRGVVGRTLLRQPKRLLSECSTWRERLDLALVEDAPREAMTAALDQARDAIVAAADTTELERIRDEGGLHGMLAEVHRNLRLLCEKLPPSIDVLPPGAGAEAPESPPREVALQPFPLREVAVTLFGQHAAARLASVEPSVERGVESTFMTLVDGANTVRFHVDAAIAELAQAPGGKVPADVLRTARDFALGGIGRAAENIEAFVEAVGAELDVHVQDIERVLIDAMDRVVGLVRKGDPREVTALLGGHLERPAEEPTGRVHQLQGWLRTRAVPPKGLARRLGARMGLSAPTADVGRQAEELLTAVPRDIPETYRRLFLPAPVGMETLFVPRTREMAILEAAVARWRRGEPTAVLIAAPVGIGRRSLLERALRGLLSEYPTQRRRIGARVTSERDAVRELSRLVGSQRDLTHEELRAKLTGTGRAIRVVEDAHRLYLPHPAALGGMERFLRALTDSGPQVLWIVTVEAHARAQLDLLLRFSDVFTHLIELTGFDRGETERLVRARHQVSGATLRFLPPPGRRGQRRSQEQLARACFDALHRDSGGHPTLALFLWLRQLRRWDEEASIVEVGPPTPVRFDFLARLDWERLLDLKRLLLYGAMTPAGFAMAHRLPTGDGEMRLRALERASLVRAERVGHEVRFALEPVLVHPLTRLLEERNLL